MRGEFRTEHKFKFIRTVVVESRYNSGANPGFSFDYVPARTLRARNRTHFRQGSRPRLNLKALEALGWFQWSLALSEQYFKHSGFKKLD